MSFEGQAKLSPLLPAIAQAIGEELERLTGEKVLFALHIFGEGNDKTSQYISNANRQDVAKALEELLERWKKTAFTDDGPLHLVNRTVQ